VYITLCVVCECDGLRDGEVKLHGEIAVQLLSVETPKLNVAVSCSANQSQSRLICRVPGKANDFVAFTNSLGEYLVALALGYV
jgi:thiamine monophosphate kinase